MQINILTRNSLIPRISEYLVNTFLVSNLLFQIKANVLVSFGG